MSIHLAVRGLVNSMKKVYFLCKNIWGTVSNIHLLKTLWSHTFLPSTTNHYISHTYGRTIGNSVVKLLYIFIHFISFSLIDKSLNGRFRLFGMDWLYWKPDEGERIIKLGEVLFPIFGLCDVIEGGLDKRWSTVNIHRLICEYSHHVLYHYVLLILWFLIIIGFVLSVASLLHYMLWKPFSHWWRKAMYLILKGMHYRYWPCEKQII